MLDVLTIGDIKLDTFIVIPDASVMCGLKERDCKLCLDYGAKIPIEYSSSEIAGSAPNVAVGIARMGHKSAVVSAMGKDITNTLAMDFLKHNGVETRFITAKDGRASSYAAVLSFKGESTQLAVLSDVDYRLPSPPPKTLWMHVGELGTGYERLYRDVIGAVRKSGVCVSFNPGQVQLKERKKDLFAMIAASEVLFVNRVEAAELLALPTSTAIRTVLTKLYALGADDVVVTDGANGAYAYDGKTAYFVPAFPGKRVEATGAGDAFVTGYLGALIHKKSADEALRWGSVNAASVIGTVGPTTGLLTDKAIIGRLAKKPTYKTKML